MRSQQDFRGVAGQVVAPALALALAVVLVTQTGCPLRGHCTPDDINEYSEAALVPPTGPVKDEINSQCDKVDWRYVSNHVDATATITVRVGDPFEGHDMTGYLSLYDSDAQLQQQAEIRPNENRFEFKLPVKARSRYYLKIESTDGSAPYTAEVIYERIDPCELCPAGTQCVENQCIPLPCLGLCPLELCNTVTQKCGVRDPCEGRCAEDERCNSDTGKCEAEAECRHSRDCKEGQRCSRRGRCYTPRARTPKDDTPEIVGAARECDGDGDCSDGKRCAGGKCVDTPADVEVGPRFVTGTITTVLDSKDGAIIRVALPSSHGLKTNDRGQIVGTSLTFMVSKVGGTKMEATVRNAKKSDIGKRTRVRIQASDK